MEVVKGEPYFTRFSKIKAYPYLNSDKKCEILIIGGGVNGAILNYYLSQKYQTILVEKSRLGHASTSCATVLLEYQLDNLAEDLKNCLTDKEIVDIYKMGLYSLEKLDGLIEELGNYCSYSKRSAFLYTNKKGEIKDFENEYNFRKDNGFDCSLIKKENNPYSFPIEAGIFDKNGGAEFNPYLFTKELIENSKNQSKIFENTQIVKVEQIKNKIISTTSFGEKITSDYVIYATGFNNTLFPETDVCDKYVSYSIIAKPNTKFSWYDKSLLQDNLDTYHYLRLLPDGSIIVGGEDTKYKNVIDLKKAEKKYKLLKEFLENTFPALKNNITITSKFCGVFGSTKNNLGLIGRSENKKILYFLSAGANGIINALFGVELIEDLINNKKNKMEKLFSLKK